MTKIVLVVDDHFVITNDMFVVADVPEKMRNKTRTVTNKIRIARRF